MNRGLRLLSVLAVILAPVIAGGVAAAADFRTYVIRPPINNDPILVDEPLPFSAATKRR